MKKLSIALLAFAGLVVASPSFADDAAPASAAHHHGHHHKGKKKSKAAAAHKSQADDLNAASMQKVQAASSEVKAPEMPANMPAPAAQAPQAPAVAPAPAAQ